MIQTLIKHIQNLVFMHPRLIFQSTYWALRISVIIPTRMNSSTNGKLPQVGMKKGSKPKLLVRSVPRILRGMRWSQSNKKLRNHWTNIYICAYNTKSLLSEDRLHLLEERVKNVNWDIVGSTEMPRKENNVLLQMRNRLLFECGRNAHNPDRTISYNTDIRSKNSLCISKRGPILLWSINGNRTRQNLSCNDHKRLQLKSVESGK